MWKLFYGKTRQICKHDLKPKRSDHFYNHKAACWFTLIRGQCFLDAGHIPLLSPSSDRKKRLVSPLAWHIAELKSIMNCDRAIKKTDGQSPPWVFGSPFVHLGGPPSPTKACPLAAPRRACCSDPRRSVCACVRGAIHARTETRSGLS